MHAHCCSQLTQTKTEHAQTYAKSATESEGTCKGRLRGDCKQMIFFP